MSKTKKNILMVEGSDDLFVVQNIIEKRFHFELEVKGDRGTGPVFIEDCKGNASILDGSKLKAFLLNGNTLNVGLLVDADEDPGVRWRAISKILGQYITVVPESPPINGFISEADIFSDRRSGVRLGAWVMPDNQRSGSLETIIASVITSDNQSQLYRYATFASRVAKKKFGADYKTAHSSKASLRTWLAWRDEPGATYGQALQRGIVNSHHHELSPFCAWLSSLFQLNPKPVKSLDPSILSKMSIDDPEWGIF